MIFTRFEQRAHASKQFLKNDVHLPFVILYVRFNRRLFFRIVRVLHLVHLVHLQPTLFIRFHAL